MKLVLSAFVVLALSPLAQASQYQSLRCFSDARPVDGNLEEIVLTLKDNGKYDAVHHVVTAGFGFPVEDTTKTVATDLTCKFNPERPLAYCHKASHEQGESQNSGLMVHYVTTEGVDYQGGLDTSSNYKVEVYSPLLTEWLRMDVPLATSGVPSGCILK